MSDQNSVALEQLREIIEERAEKRLKADISNLHHAINCNDAIKALGTHDYPGEDNGPSLTYNKVGEKDMPPLNTQSKTYNLFQLGHSNSFGNVLFKELLPVYIRWETTRFVERVDQLSLEVEELKIGKLSDDY